MVEQDQSIRCITESETSAAASVSDLASGAGNDLSLPVAASIFLYLCSFSFDVASFLVRLRCLEFPINPPWCHPP